MTNRSKIRANRSQFVVQSNNIIRAKNNLNLTQHKLVLFCISKIRPDDTADTEYSFPIEEVCSTLGINASNGGYHYVAEELKTLTHREWGVFPDGSHKTISWLGDVEIQPNSGIAKITFNKNMQPYLYDLKRNYTQYQLNNILGLNCKHALNLYGILRSYTTQKKLNNCEVAVIRYTLTELKEQLNCENYTKWYELNRCVLKKAVDEINAYCDDVHIEYEPTRNGKVVDGVEFSIETPRPVDKVLAIDRRMKRLMKIKPEDAQSAD